MNQTGKEKNDNIIVASTILAGAQIVVRIISLLYRIPLIRIVGQEGMGYYANAYEVYQFLLLVSSNGIPVAFSLLGASYLAKREYKNLQRLMKGTMVFAGFIGLVFSLLTFFGAGWIAETMFNMEEVAPALRVLAPTIFVCALLGVYRGYFQGKNAMMPTALSQVIEQIVHALVSVVAAYFLVVKGPAYGAAGGTLGTFLGAVGGLGFCVFVYHLYAPTVRRMLRRDKTPHKDLLTYGNVVKLVAGVMAPIILSQTMYQLGGIVDALLFNHILDGMGYTSAIRSQLIGVYSGEYKLLLNVPLALTSSIGIALIPTVTRLVTLQRMRDVYQKINQIVRLTMVIAMPCSVGLMVLSGPLMQLLFSDTSELARMLLILGGPTIAFYSLSTVTISILQGIHRMKAPVVHSVIAMVLHSVALAIVFKCFDMNIYGMVFGNYVFAFVMCWLNLRALKKYIGYEQEYKYSVFMPTAVSAAMGIVAWLVYEGIYTASSSNAVSIVVAIVAAIIFYGVFIVVTGILSEDDILSLPKGQRLFALCKKLKLL